MPVSPKRFVVGRRIRRRSKRLGCIFCGAEPLLIDDCGNRSPSPFRWRINVPIEPQSICSSCRLQDLVLVVPMILRMSSRRYPIAARRTSRGESLLTRQNESRSIVGRGTGNGSPSASSVRVIEGQRTACWRCCLLHDRLSVQRCGCRRDGFDGTPDWGEGLLIETAGVTVRVQYHQSHRRCAPGAARVPFSSRVEADSRLARRRLASLAGLAYDLSYQHPPSHSLGELQDRVGLAFERLGARATPDVFHWLGRSPVVLEGVLEMIEVNILHAGVLFDR